MKYLIATILTFLLIGYYAHAGTFGYEGVGANSNLMTSNLAASYIFTSPASAGSSVSITALIRMLFSFDPVFKMCIWQLDGTLLGCSISHTGDGWVTESLTVPLIPSTDYRLGIINSANTIYAYDTGTTDYGATSTNSYTTPTNFTIPTVKDNYKMSIYVTYNEIPSTPKVEIIKGGLLEIKQGGTLEIK